jgi:hypothetical protein
MRRVFGARLNLASVARRSNNFPGHTDALSFKQFSFHFFGRYRGGEPMNQTIIHVNE